MGFSLFIRSRIYSLPSTLGTPEGLLEQSLWLYLERPQGYWNGLTWLRAP